jgi:hypothetical protein
MSRGLVYTLHLWPPIAHAKHYTGTAKDARRLPERLTEHALGRGARLTQVQVERGGSWVVAQTEPGGRDRERSLKQHGASRRCEVCKAVDGYQAGDLSQEQALARAGWDRATEHERALLADMFGISGPRENISAQPGTQPAAPAPDGEVRVIPAPRPAPGAQHITPEIVGLVDQLQATWDAGAQPGPRAPDPAPQPAAEREMEPQA